MLSSRNRIWLILGCVWLLAATSFAQSFDYRIPPIPVPASMYHLRFTMPASPWQPASPETFYFLGGTHFLGGWIRSTGGRRAGMYIIAQQNTATWVGKQAGQWNKILDQIVDAVAADLADQKKVIFFPPRSLRIDGRPAMLISVAGPGNGLDVASSSTKVATNVWTQRSICYIINPCRNNQGCDLIQVGFAAPAKQYDSLRAAFDRLLRSLRFTGLPPARPSRAVTAVFSPSAEETADQSAIAQPQPSEANSAVATATAAAVSMSSSTPMPDQEAEVVSLRKLSVRLRQCFAAYPDYQLLYTARPSQVACVWERRTGRALLVCIILPQATVGGALQWYVPAWALQSKRVVLLMHPDLSQAWMVSSVNLQKRQKENGGSSKTPAAGLLITWSQAQNSPDVKGARLVAFDATLPQALAQMSEAWSP